jgi:transcriptional regulator with XRE-family HTH domain
MSRDAFGPNLRRTRLQRGITLQTISEETKISVEMLAGLERNDFSQWPYGIYARAYVRQYAYAIGLDPDVTVDEFCRWFPQGDRRLDRQIRGQAEIVNHDLKPGDELPDGVAEDRRWTPAADESDPAARAQSAARPPSMFTRLRRVLSRA